MVDIAERADVAPATVYNLIGTRHEVMRAVLDTAISCIADRAEPVDPAQPIESTISLLATAAEVLLEDPVAYRRAIAAMSEQGADGWLKTTLGQLLEDRLAELEVAFDGSIPLPRLAELINIGFRGVLISWSYGQIADDRLASTGAELALHVLGTTACPDIALDIKRQLITLAKETP